LTSCGIFAPTLVGDPAAGEAFYVLECQRCHTTVELKVFSNLIVNDLGTLDAQMEGLLLTDQEIANLQAFLPTQ
jgi:hypothetical protein